jgi:hypothetical protein
MVDRLKSIQVNWLSVLHGVISNAIWWGILFVLGLIAAAVAGVIALARGNARIAFFLFGVASILLLLVVIALFLYRRDRKKRAAAAAQPAVAVSPVEPPAPEPLADRGSVRDLKTFYHYLDRAAQWAIDFLAAGICRDRLASEGDKALVAKLILEEILPKCRESKEHLDRMFNSTEVWTEPKFDDAMARTRILLYDYYRLLTEWIGSAGPAIRGKERFESSEGYLELRHRQWELLLEAERMRTRADLKGIVPPLSDLQNFFPGRVRTSMAGHLKRIGARELHEHVRNEGASHFVGREWSPDSLKLVEEMRIDEQGQTLHLTCMTDDGYAVALETARYEDLEKLLGPGKHVQAWGTIKEVSNNSIVLAPAQLISVESDPR